jgi:autotransporter-associated beta strand protein
MMICPKGVRVKFLSAVSFCMLIAALLLLVGTASAATRTWDGSNSVSWGTAANWVGGFRPTTGDSVILTGAGTYRPTNQNRANPLSLIGLTFDPTTTTAFTVGGSPIRLTATGTDLTVQSGAAGHTLSCPMQLAAAQTWSQDSSEPFTVSGVISQFGGTRALTKTGTGTLIFSGTNTYTGATTISAGTLQLGNGAKAGLILPAANLITDNSVLIYNTPSTITHSGVISGSGTFTKSGTGTLTLSGTETYTGVTTVSAGTLSLGNGIKTGLILPAANLITDNSVLIYNTPSTITHSGAISGPGTFTKSGNGVLTLSGANSYTGTTTVTAGTLQLGDGTATGNIIPAANLITDNAGLRYNTPSTITHSGVISGPGTFTKLGTGTLTLSGANSYTGTTTVSAGELQFNGVNTGASAKTVSGGTLSGTGTIPGAVTVANVASSKLRGGTGSGTTGTLTINGALTFSGAQSALDVTSDGTSLSLVSVGTNTITETAGMRVNLLNPMPEGTYTLISTTSAGLPTTLPTLGTNLCGKVPVFAWKSGTGLIVTLYSGPTVSGISPMAGGTTGGTTVIITGTDFTGANNVKFGTTANVTGAMTVNSDTQITVTSPAHAAGTVNVTVTTPGGTSDISSDAEFTYDDVPTVTGISPGNGPTSGDTAVTITGTGFYLANNVKFGTTANATGAMTVNSDTQITVTSPAHAAGTVDVTVTSPGGTSASSPSDQFTYFVPGVALTLSESSIPLTLIAGSTATDSNLGITVTANVPFTIMVADNTGRSANQGYMGSYSGGAYDAAGPILALPLELEGTTTGTTEAQSITPPITSTSQTLYLGSAAVTDQLLAPNIFSQPVESTDQGLSGGSTYRIDLSFTIQTA